MKLTPLLAQFLLIKKQLNLAGIGRFSLEEITEFTEESSKGAKNQPIGKISFDQDITTRQDDELISFLAEHSGKMKSLAAADLDSHLELARQFLNIGKPFLLEGIGTLTKNKSGILEFQQAFTGIERIKESNMEGVDLTSTTEASFTDYEEMLSPKKSGTPPSKKIIIWIVVLITISVAILGGYYVYNKSKKQEEPSIQKEINEVITVPYTDTLNKADSLLPKDTLTSPISVVSSGKYRFVIEKAARQRALKRFADLQSYGLDIKMETKDSVMFKLFFEIVATPADTTRIKDSLQIRYSTRGITTIEKD